MEDEGSIRNPERDPRWHCSSSVFIVNSGSPLRAPTEREHTFPLLRFTSSALKAARVANGSGEDACSTIRTTTVTKAFMSFYESAVHHPRLRFVVGKDTRAVLEGPNRPGDILDAKGFPQSQGSRRSQARPARRDRSRRVRD